MVQMSMKKDVPAREKGAGSGEVSWAGELPAEQWSVYERVLEAADRLGIRYAVGGGLAFSHYARRWRNTKDIDIYVMPAMKEAMIGIVQGAGLRDYYEVMGYDRNWIYRSHDGRGTIVDVMWQMANYRAEVDEAWLTRGDLVKLHGRTVRLLPAEELMWSKLYIMQRERCDWGDLLNIMYARGPALDWGHLLGRVGEDRRVLAGVLEVFVWACPDRARELPVGVWESLGIAGPAVGVEEPEVDRGHIRLLDSRDWFGPNLPGKAAG
jgi:hypothetical protein